MAVPDEPDQTQDEAEPASVVRARDRLDRNAESVRTEQLEQALSRLRARGDLTDQQRAVAERLSERLVEGVLGGPQAALRDPASQTETARTVLELFD